MNLKSDFIWTASSRAIYALSQWLVLIVVARLGDVEQLGMLAFALAVTGPVIVFAQLNMRTYMATDAAAKFRFADYRAAQAVTMLVAIAVLAVIALWRFPLGREAAALILVVGLYKATEGLSGVCYGALQRAGRVRDIAISVTVHGITAVSAMTAMLLAGYGVVYGAIVTFVLWTGLLLLWDGRDLSRYDDKTATRQPNVKAVIGACWPLGAVLAMLILRINVPVYFVDAYGSSADVGFYSAMAYFIVIGNMVTGSLLEVAAPRYANYYRDGYHFACRRLFLRLGVVIVSVGATGVLIAAAAGELILQLLYGAPFATHAPVLVFVMLAAAVMYVSQLFGMMLTVTRSFRQQVIANIVGIIAAVVLSVLLIPEFGLIGAALAMFGAGFTTGAVNVWSVWSAQRFLFYGLPVGSPTRTAGVSAPGD